MYKRKQLLLKSPISRELRMVAFIQLSLGSFLKTQKPAKIDELEEDPSWRHGGLPLTLENFFPSHTPMGLSLNLFKLHVSLQSQFRTIQLERSNMSGGTQSRVACKKYVEIPLSIGETQLLKSMLNSRYQVGGMWICISL